MHGSTVYSKENPTEDIFRYPSLWIGNPERSEIASKSPHPPALTSAKKGTSPRKGYLFNSAAEPVC